MAWGYRLELLNGRDSAGRGSSEPRCCSVRGCEHGPRYLGVYRYVRATGRAITASRPLCAKHAGRFSMQHGLAWPQFLRRVRRPLAAVWDLAA